MTLVLHDDPPLQVCVEVLSAAFAQEPAVMRFCGTDERRRTAWFDALLRTHASLPGSRLILARGDRPVAAALVTPPGCRPTAAAQWGWTGRTLWCCGPRPLIRTLDYLRRTEPWKPAGAWTLDFVGVLPGERGRGLARRLCDRGQADHPEAPAFLTTADPRNVALYEDWGFGACARAVIGGLAVVGMSRGA